jgi:hypothetical protein
VFLNQLNPADPALHTETMSKARCPSFVAIGRDEGTTFFNRFLNLTDAASHLDLVSRADRLRTISTYRDAPSGR